MRQVINNAGEVIPGLYRADTGVLIVKNSHELHKKKREQQLIADIEQLKSDVKILTDKLDTIIKGKHG